MKKKLSPDKVKIKLMHDEIKFLHLEISRLETQIRIMKSERKNHELRGWGVINGELRDGISKYITGQYSAHPASCSSIRRSKDTNR